jgi:hypothetical protein
MFQEIKPRTPYSQFGLYALIASIIATMALALADGLLRGYAIRHMTQSDGLTMLMTWVVDFRYVFEQFIYAAAIFFIGAKFFETRTVLSVSFDRLDAARMSVTGPDENNVVWIGRRFATPLEAQAVAETLAERLKQST